MISRRIMVLNAQDLFLFMDKHDATELESMTEIKWQLMSSSLFMNKELEKCLMLAKTILTCQTDVVMLTEVGGQESLENFARFVLKDEYQALSLPSNSDRGIDLGYLVRKSLPFRPELRSYIDYPLPAPAHRFSRDVLRLDLHEKGELKLILLLVHIKSKLDIRKTDYEGRGRRVLEVKGLLRIYQELEKLDVPILVGGDFNGHAGETHTEEEFKTLYEETDLKDMAFLAGVPDEDRFSHVYFTRTGRVTRQQIDYLFVSERFASRVVPEECFFPRFVNLKGAPLPIPTRYEQKNLMPSDHFPFLGTIRI